MTILSVRNWLKPLYRRSVLCWHHQRQDRTLPARLVPRLEVLEDRTVPSTLMVTNNLDTGVAGDGSLRGEIAAAQSGDTIVFDPSLAGQTITLTSGKLAINKSLDIKGLGANQLTVSGNNASRVFDITASNASVTIDGLTLTKGRDVTDAIDCIANAGNLTVSNCDVSGNFGYYTSNIVIANTGTLTISYSTVSERRSRIKNTGTLNFSYSTFSGSDTLAIENFGTATVSYSTLSGNKAGAIINRDTGTMTVSYSTLSGNGGTSVAGGAIANSGALTINNSTLSGNTAVGSPGFDGLGGAICMSGGTLALNSSTLSGNRVYGGDSVITTSGGLTSPGSGQGGGLYVVAGTVTIDHSTIAGNEAHGGIGLGYSAGVGGGIYEGTSAAVIQMHDTILANNIADAQLDLSGSITSRGYNLIGNATGGSGFAASDLLNVNPKLGPLQNNGGPTQTMALLAGSPAIDAGDNTGAPAYDQRGPGFARIVNGIIDIGAFEVQNAGGPAVSDPPPGASPPVKPSWKAAASMSEPRSYYTATLLGDGRVLVAGGFVHTNGIGPPLGGAYSATAEIYDPRRDTWTPTGDLLTTLAGQGAVRLQDGRVLVAGGQTIFTPGGPTVVLNSAEIYDPATGQWTATGSMHVPRIEPILTLLPDGRVLVAGAARTLSPDGKSAEIYDPATGEWTRVADMSISRNDHVQELLDDGRVLVAGGFKGTLMAPGEYLASAEIYDPGTDTWTPTGSMTMPRADAEGIRLKDGRVLATGGNTVISTPATRTNTAEIYDPATGQWKLTGGVLSEAKVDHAITLLKDGRVLVAGGVRTNETPVASADLYDPRTDTWTPLPSMSRSRYGIAAVTLKDGRALVIGGLNFDADSFPDDALASAELFVPARRHGHGGHGHGGHGVGLAQETGSAHVAAAFPAMGRPAPAGTDSAESLTVAGTFPDDFGSSVAVALTTSSKLLALAPTARTSGDERRLDRLFAAGLDDGTSFLVPRSRRGLWSLGDEQPLDEVS